MFLWMVSAFNYFLINFQLRYLMGDIYRNQIISSLSEVAAYLVSGAIGAKLGNRVCLIVSFLIALVGSILLVLYEDMGHSVMAMILATKFGISSCFSAVYLANSLFPPLYASTTLGICNFLARLVSMIAPPFAEFDKPLPMILFALLSLAGTFVSMFLRTAKSE